MREEFCPANQQIITEGQDPKWIYLIAEGECTLHSKSNPFTGMALRSEHKGLDSKAAVTSMIHSTAQGSLSHTLHTNPMGVMQAGQWVGEEFVMMDLPVIYSLVAKTPCKLLKIHVEDFKEYVHDDVKAKMLKKTKKKVKWMRDRMHDLHE